MRVGGGSFKKAPIFKRDPSEYQGTALFGLSLLSPEESDFLPYPRVGHVVPVAEGVQVSLRYYVYGVPESSATRNSNTRIYFQAYTARTPRSYPTPVYHMDWPYLRSSSSADLLLSRKGGLEMRPITRNMRWVEAMKWCLEE